MREEVAARLASELRSGKYNQITRVLCRIEADDQSRTPTGHCCLGVLSEIAVEEGVIKKVDSPQGSFALFGTEEELSGKTYGLSLLPASVVKWAGLEDEDENEGENGTIYFDLTDHPKVSVSGNDRKLNGVSVPLYSIHCGKVIIPAHELNDTYKFTFDDIAELLENRKYVNPMEVSVG